MVKIVTDSASDMENDELKTYSVEKIPLAVSFGDKNYLDGEDLFKDEFYRLLESEKEFPKTSQPSPDAFLEIFERAREAGDSLVVILLSAALSGTVQSAQIAKELSGYDDIHIIDSRLVSGGEKVLVIYAASLRDKGYSASAIAKEVEKLRDRSRLAAGLDTLEYLCKGGRLSKTAAGIGTLANIKPIIKLTKEGAVVLADKCMGHKSQVKRLIKYPENDGIDYRFPICFLYSQDKGNCEEFMEKMKEAGYDLSNSCVVNIGPAIGSHIGIGAIGIVYFTQEE
ncbi:DegV domain-containing protein [Clostridiales bacterium]|nr:DegV domain-containing protein [Clostridiales bacterium]